MLRMMLIKKYVNTSDIQSTIGHSPVVYLKEAFVMIVLLFVLYVILLCLIIRVLLPIGSGYSVEPDFFSLLSGW